MNSSLPYFNSSPPSPDPSTPSPTAKTSAVFVSVVGSFVALLLVAGSISAAFFLTRARVEAATTAHSTRSEEEEAKKLLLLLLQEKPELVEIKLGEGNTVEKLGRIDENVLPLSLTLLPSPIATSGPSKNRSRAVVSFILLLPSSLEVQPSVDEENEPEFAFGSHIVWVEEEEEKEEEGSSRLMDLGES